MAKSITISDKNYEWLYNKVSFQRQQSVKVGKPQNISFDDILTQFRENEAEVKQDEFFKRISEQQS